MLFGNQAKSYETSEPFQDGSGGHHCSGYLSSQQPLLRSAGCRLQEAAIDLTVAANYISLLSLSNPLPHWRWPFIIDFQQLTFAGVETACTHLPHASPLLAPAGGLGVRLSAGQLEWSLPQLSYGWVEQKMTRVRHTDVTKLRARFTEGGPVTPRQGG